MILTIPMECYVARHCLVSIVNRIVLEIRIYRNNGEPVSEYVLSDSVSTLYRMVVSILVWGSTTAIGLVVLDLGIVLSLTGKRRAKKSFIFPPLLHPS